MKIYTVSEFINVTSDYLETGLGTIIIQGEVTGYRISRSNLVYFELKDEKSRVLCFGLTHEVSVSLEDGMEIRVQGLSKLFKGTGGFHVRIQEIEPVGQGALQKAFMLLQKKLEKEGIFSEQHKQALPKFPESIGLITSRDAAAYKDVLIRLDERWGGLDISHANVGVQGLVAIPQIVRAIDYFNKEYPVDVLILTRGGGSLEDLQAFNDEKVIRAIFSSKIPIIVGVGHERDITLSEMSADVRASTPTNAAELVIPHQRDIAYQLEQNKNLLVRSIENRIIDYKSVITQLVDRVGVWLGSIQQDLSHQVHLMKSLSPQATLKRGYSITLKDDKVVRKISEVKKGDSLTIKLSNGEVVSEVS